MDIDKFLEKENKHLRKVRDKILRPLLRFLYKDRISANDLTNFRLVLAGVFFLLFNQYRGISLIIITITLLLDTIDGSLARYEKFISDRGKFLDMITDSAVYILIISTFLYHGLNPVLFAANVILINYTYLFAAVKKNEFKKSDWIIRPTAHSTYLRAIPVIAFYLFHLFGADYLELSVYISTIMCAVLAVYYYTTIQIRWRKKYGKGI